LVIVKKAPELVIEKNIARIFKRVNILEYKSPEDYFSVYDFYKVLSYAYLYAALNRIDTREMTVSIIETRHPRELFAYFGEEKNVSVTETSPGVYVVSGYPIGIQVIESKRLPFGENLWLNGLSNDLNAAVAGLILEESRKGGACGGAWGIPTRDNKRECGNDRGGNRDGEWGSNSGRSAGRSRSYRQVGETR
jgi:hypothetical protein